MTERELKEYVLKERIKAYIYFGVEAEMEAMEYRRDREDPNEKHNLEYNSKEVKLRQDRIGYCNKRIDDLIVHHEVTK